MVDELQLNTYCVNSSNDSSTFKPDADNTNFYRQQDIFTKAKEMTKSTVEIEDVYADLTDAGASTRDLQAYDIAARPYNISGFKVMVPSDMYKKFLEINSDDFSEGLNSHNEKVMLFDKSKSDGKVKMFSTEIDSAGNEYYAIRDKNGNIWKFDQDGKAIT